ncbi:iron ABC transporter substrate-binding protein [Brenneria roseae subsp. americana]|uniref:Iron ABC transporter substrate-binding protein n=1 Tax=Brenneria roseae subsp. americana TaxID=1508507 RepID=A0A2U1TN72_9GAMM|nr:siderophore ABC transporter substrate-binding protein [Brenneria roseae]PWC10864.1 iron ABC transporter substrate-binding protein [Brenneria roseae subsp. americana]PWC17551.1 iron ABC transporter substrate-binding protein [Brenneria roseae subsp. roseae]
MSKIKITPLHSVAVALSFLLLAGCDDRPAATESAAPKTVTIEHAQGTTEVPLNPQNVIVFNPETLDILDALDVKISGVPQTSIHLPSFLSKYSGSEYLNAGTLFEPNYEALSSAKPDLIIAGARATDAYDKLSGIAPTISLSVDDNNFIDSLTQRTEQIGLIFGKEKEAQQKLDAFKQQVEQVKAKSAHAGNAMVLMISGGKLSAYNPKSRFGFVFDVLGFQPAIELPQEGRHGNVVSPELLLQYNPDWLFVLSRDSAIGRTGEDAAKQVLDNPLVHKTTAWQKNQIVYMDSSALYVAGGLQSYSRLMDDVNKALDQHPAN